MDVVVADVIIVVVSVIVVVVVALCLGDTIFVVVANLESL